VSDSQVALIRGDDRYHNVLDALKRVAADIDLSARRHVLVKPNFVVTDRPLATTHVDAVRAVLDFVRERYQGPITIAEGPSARPAAEGFRRYGYEPLSKIHGVEFLDLNYDEPVSVQVYDRRLRPMRLLVARSVLESDFRISVGPPKTHDVVMVTLSLKNMIMGSLISRLSHTPSSGNRSGPDAVGVKKTLLRLVPLWMRRLPFVEWIQFWAMSTLEPSDKMKMHQSYPVINLNLALLAPLLKPHLSVIDGFEAMDGNGPTGGTPVSLRVALASTDALAADVVGAALMGFDADEVGYLHYCRKMGLGSGDLDRIDLVGNAPLASCVRPFRPHHAIHRQRRWRSSRVEMCLP
jgi:uncharacterized protein (DUF362 family)